MAPHSTWQQETMPVHSRRQLAEQLLLQTDRQGAIIQFCFLIGAIIDFIVNYGRQTGGWRVIILVSMDAALLVLQYCLASASAWYRYNRTAVILLLQLSKLVLAIKYIPPGFRSAGPVQLAAGKQASYTYKCLAYGLASFHIAYDTLCSRIALRYAFPFTLVKLALSMWGLLPSQTAVLRIPEVAVVAASVKRLIHDLYSMVLSAVTADHYVAAYVPATCPSISLSLWCHLCLGGLLPLYYLAAVEGCLPGCRASSSSSNTESSSSRQSSRRSESSNGNTSAGSSSDLRTSSNRSNLQPAAAPGSSPSSTSNDGNLARYQQPQQQPGPSATPVVCPEPPDSAAAIHSSPINSSSSSSGYYSCLYHLLVLFGSSMVLWAAVDVVTSSAPVTAFLQQKGLCV